MLMCLFIGQQQDPSGEVNSVCFLVLKKSHRSRGKEVVPWRGGKLIVFCLPLHGLQSSSLRCVTLNALLMHLALTHLRSQRKLRSILQGTRCWIRGSEWKKFRTSHITGTENRPRGREGVKERPTYLPLSTQQPQRDMPPTPSEAWGLCDHGWPHQGKVKAGCDFPLCCSVLDSSVAGFGGRWQPQQQTSKSVSHAAFIGIHFSKSKLDQN